MRVEKIGDCVLYCGVRSGGLPALVIYTPSAYICAWRISDLFLDATKKPIAWLHHFANVDKAVELG
jgi:hypothetical protein